MPLKSMTNTNFTGDMASPLSLSQTSVVLLAELFHSLATDPQIIGLFVVIARHDFLWCIAAVWINICILIKRPKSEAGQVRAFHLVSQEPFGAGWG